MLVSHQRPGFVSRDLSLREWLHNVFCIKSDHDPSLTLSNCWVPGHNQEKVFAKVAKRDDFVDYLIFQEEKIHSYELLFNSVFCHDLLTCFGNKKQKMLLQFGFI